jgi:hypothetical protein
MRKERMVAMMFLVVVLAGVLALPQGFAKTKVMTKNFGNRPQLVPAPVKTPAKSPITTHQSGSGLLVSNGLQSNVAFATSVN